LSPKIKCGFAPVAPKDAQPLLATVESVEEVDNLFDSFNGGMHVDLGKILHCPLQ
jgi:hypothetical protein